MSFEFGVDLIQMFYLACSNYCFRNIGIIPSIFVCKNSLEKIERTNLVFEDISVLDFSNCINGAEIKLNSILQMPENSAMCDADVLFSKNFTAKSPCSLNSEKLIFYQDYKNSLDTIKKCTPSQKKTSNAGLLYCKNKQHFDEYAERSLSLCSEFRKNGDNDDGICFEQMFWERFWEEKSTSINYIAEQSNNNFEGIMEMNHRFGVFHPIGASKRSHIMIKKAVEIVNKTKFKDEFNEFLEKNFKSFIWIANFT